MWWWWWLLSGCKLSLSYRQSSSWGISLLLDRPLPLSGSTLSSPEGTKFGYEAQKSTRPTLRCFCPTDTSECVCVCARGVKASCLHSCLGSRPSPLPARVPGPGPLRSVEPNVRTQGGRERGELGSAGGLLHLSVVTLQRGPAFRFG